jgi:hypothetical protein
MLNWRLYRMGLLPVLGALAVAAFSLGARPAAISSTLAPDSFDGSRASSELSTLVKRFPQRRPGSEGDDELASYIVRRLRELGGTSGGGFGVRVQRFAGETIEGKRELLSVIAKRPGTGGGPPIVIFAHRDAVAPYSAAELSGTAVLLELARVLAASETQRTIVLVSSSGGSAGAAGAIDFAASEAGPFDAAIVLGDLAGERTSKPLVVPFSDGLGGAPDVLQLTVAQQVAHQFGVDPGGLSVPGQLAHLIFPFAVGEQGPLDGAGVPAVMLQVSGERGPPAREPVISARLQHLGSAALGAIYALDGGPEVPPPSAQLLIEHKEIPSWAVRLVVGALLIAPFLLAFDGLARLRRRRERLGSPALWALSLALPFLACALFARALGLLGVIPAPPIPVLAQAAPLDRSALQAVAAVALVLLGSWLAWTWVARRAHWSAIDGGGFTGLFGLLLLVAVGLLAWAFNPFAALLLVPALHVWPPIVGGELQEVRPPVQRLGVLLLLGLGVLPLGLLIAYYAAQLGLGPGELAWSVVLLLSGGHTALGAAALLSLALGATVAIALAGLARQPGLEGPAGREWEADRIRTRGPLGYAGPGSLGGTESALRR